MHGDQITHEMTCKQCNSTGYKSLIYMYYTGTKQQNNYNKNGLLLHVKTNHGSVTQISASGEKKCTKGFHISNYKP